MRVFTPNAPPKAVPLSPTEEARAQARIRSLIGIAEGILAERRAEVDAHILLEDAEDAPAEGPEANQLMMNATLKRNAFLEAFMLAHNPLREIQLRGADHGLEQAFIDQTVTPWISQQLTSIAPVPRNGAGSWTFFHFLLSISLSMCRTELLKTIGAQPDDRQLRDLEFAVDVFMDDVLNANIEHLGRPQQDFIKNWQLYVWQDVLYWFQFVEHEETKRRGLAIAEEELPTWLRDRSFSMRSRDPNVRNAIAQIYIQAAQLADQLGATGSRDTFLIKVQSANTALKNNAGRFLAYFANKGQDQSAGRAIGSHLSGNAIPATSLETGRAFPQQADGAIEADMEERFLTNAVINLRAGLAGLLQHRATIAILSSKRRNWPISFLACTNWVGLI